MNGAQRAGPAVRFSRKAPAQSPPAPPRNDLDAAAGDNLRPWEGWAAFRRLLLTEDGFARIAGNVAPYRR